MISAPTDHEARLTALEIDNAELHETIEHQQSVLRELHEAIERLDADRRSRPT